MWNFFKIIQGPMNLPDNNGFAKWIFEIEDGNE